MLPFAVRPHSTKINHVLKSLASRIQPHIKCAKKVFFQQHQHIAAYSFQTRIQIIQQTTDTLIMFSSSLQCLMHLFCLHIENKQWTQQEHLSRSLTCFFFIIYLEKETTFEMILLLLALLIFLLFCIQFEK